MQKYVFLKNLDGKGFHLISRTKETRYIEWHETCKFKCRLDESVCNNNNAGIIINAGVNVKN